MKLPLNVRISNMAELKAEFREHLTRPGVKNDQEVCILFAGKWPENE